MPSVMDMVEIMERLESKALHVDPAHCVKIRNRNASCSRCADACPSGAIALHDNALDIDSEKCMACGACASACPTNAISFMKPTDEEFDRAVDESAQALEGDAVVVCARVASHRAADVETTATVPCVSRLDTQALVGACARNDASLVVVDGGCKTCKYRFASRQFDISQKEANELLSAWDVPFRIERTQQVPLRAAAKDALQGVGGVSRRGFFTEMKASAKDIAVEAVNVTVESELGIRRKGPDSLRDILKVDDDGNMPRITPARHDALMEYLFEMGEPREGSSVKTRLWGKVDIDESLCTRCGMCSTFCPTGALSKVFGEGDGKKKPSIEGIEFRLADCVQCRLCEDSCMQKALRVSDEIPCNLILDLEPRLFKGEARKAESAMRGLFGN